MKTFAQTILIYYICAKYKIRMIRKFTAITLLSMASIVMLAFVVFPHHHHNEYICFATAHCQDEGENEEHSHDTGSSNHRCVKNLFQTQINRGQNVEHQSEEGAYHHFLFPIFLNSYLLKQSNNVIPIVIIRKNFIQPVIYQPWPAEPLLLQYSFLNIREIPF